MRRLALTASVVALGLSGCAGQNGVATSAPTAAEIAAFVAQVQQYASAACAFEPTAITIAQIATSASASGTAGVALAKVVAGEICGAVTAKSARRGDSAHPHVGKVVVHGTFENGTRI